MIELWAIIEEGIPGHPNIVGLCSQRTNAVWPAVSTNKKVIEAAFDMLDERSKKNGARIVKFQSEE